MGEKLAPPPQPAVVAPPAVTGEMTESKLTATWHVGPDQPSAAAVLRIPELLTAARQGGVHGAYSSAAASHAPLNLAGKVAMIKDTLGLDGNLSVASAIHKAQEEVGCDARGNLNQQADALLFELVPTDVAPV